MVIITPNDRPKSVRNRCVIEVFGGVFVLSHCFLDFCGCRGFCHRTESDLLLFLLIFEENFNTENKLHIRLHSSCGTNFERSIADLSQSVCVS